MEIQFHRTQDFLIISSSSRCNNRGPNNNSEEELILNLVVNQEDYNNNFKTKELNSKFHKELEAVTQECKTCSDV